LAEDAEVTHPDACQDNWPDFQGNGVLQMKITSMLGRAAGVAAAAAGIVGRQE
jgi:hypothetical protein